MWYVIQVAGGRERSTLAMVSRMVDNNILDEAFVPQREIMRHQAGQWVRTQEVLFPGHVFIVAAQPERILAQLRKVPAFTRLLGNGRCFLPLSDVEVDAIAALCGKDRLVKMSEGVIEGDGVRVTRGPLCGCEGLIRKVDRHKRAAYVEMQMLGRHTLVKLGLEIVRKYG